MNEIRHVRQKHARGCVVACLSMITGIPYDEVDAGFHGDREKDGLGYHQYDAWLNQLGYAVIRRFWHYCPLQADRADWPCQPFADVHLVCLPSPMGEHAVVMLKDGSVLDPNESSPKRLSDYPKINSIAGIYRVSGTFPPERLIGLHWTHNSGKCSWCGADGQSYAYHDPCPARQDLRTPA
ncbi:MAG TPA: hypothetical protein VK797_23325 [Tepidisphaeraceae bacterium]|jgi:hypothetical protein|nr:hypothetical protein [Tepidisphaeraceae bacterium]